MEHELIDMLWHLPIAVRITIQRDQGNTIWYIWQVAENNGKSQNLIQATEQALASVFTFIATDAHTTVGHLAV